MLLASAWLLGFSSSHFFNRPKILWVQLYLMPLGNKERWKLQLRYWDSMFDEIQSTYWREGIMNWGNQGILFFFCLSLIVVSTLVCYQQSLQEPFCGYSKTAALARLGIRKISSKWQLQTYLITLWDLSNSFLLAPLTPAFTILDDFHSKQEKHIWNLWQFCLLFLPPCRSISLWMWRHSPGYCSFISHCPCSGLFWTNR